MTRTLPAPLHADKPHPALFLLIAFTLLLGGCATGVRVKDTTRTFTTVVIDAGHGGGDNGATTRWAGKEKHHALSVARRLEPKLQAAGFRTVMTRTDDRFIELNQRARLSNRQENAVFVSVHFNYSPRRKIRGSEVYYRSPVSRLMAQRILAQIDAIPGASARYVKTANFRVLRLNQYPAVLVECGYLTNKSEGALCAKPAHHERLATAIADGLIQTRGGVPAARAVAATEPVATR
jgi:N-acetylmuramoyl-L-alanine amidase